MSDEQRTTRLRDALARAEEVLLAAQNDQHHWTGELSSSALSTATAITALAIVERESQVRSSEVHRQVLAGLTWLVEHSNSDGGWGDTVLSLSNLSTTALCWAAFGAVRGANEPYRLTVEGAERWLTKRAGGIEPDRLAAAIINSYGKDRTFSVPILTMCALAGRLGAGSEAWKNVLPLPFELAACPHRWFAALRLPVVSYALPALIAIGQARHHYRPSRNPIVRLVRNLTSERTLKILDQIQPRNGGFLEATPLTSFVVMSLAGSGQAGNPVTLRGVEFLMASQRADGSWPIDTNLATWVTTLAVNALSGPGTPSIELQASNSALQTRSWLMAQQYRQEHPYTHAAPGGWAWTDLPGGVPDADDTAGALLALHALGPVDKETRAAALAGIKWLLKLQNRDGGIPTFCRGWGALPFDRSSPDLTAHALRAWTTWLETLPQELQLRTQKALQGGLEFLAKSQQPDGSWIPLWFGNQFAPHDVNPTYGTARVLRSLTVMSEQQQSLRALAARLSARAIEWLVRSQNSDGGWGGALGIRSSIEESALAVEALGAARQFNVPRASVALEAGTDWLLERIETGQWTQPSPIGFYFAKLWYYERLYPLIFTVGALKHSK